MGHHGGDQNRLLYSFNLDDHVPASHLLRGINEFLDLSDLHGYLAPFYSHTDRPSMDPELMIRMLIVGYRFDIRSLFRHPLGAPSFRRRASELGLSLVLPPRPHTPRAGTRPLAIVPARPTRGSSPGRGKLLSCVLGVDLLEPKKARRGFISATALDKKEPLSQSTKHYIKPRAEDSVLIAIR